MILLLPILAMAAQADPPNPAWNCDDPVQQQAMNWCAHQAYQAADARLNEQWDSTAAAMKAMDQETDGLFENGPGYFEALLRAQRAWIAFRDANCTSAGYYARGGTLEPLLVSICKTDMTERRTEELRNLMERP